MLAPVRTAAPAALITTSEAKAQCRIDSTDEDTLIDSLVSAAVSHLDGYSGVLGRALVTQTWQQDFSGFCSKLRLPVGDLIAVTGVTYYDTSNAQQTLASSVYTAFTDSLGPYVTLKPDQVWPSIYSRADAVRVTWTAGYGAAAAVPPAIKQAALLLIAHWYDNRSGVAVGETPTEMPLAVNSLLAPFRRVGP